jgi:tRNA(Ile)-lysidine synthase
MSRGASTLRATLLLQLPRRGRILLAVSGGLDSMVLLHLTQGLKKILRSELGVVHVDHGLRATSGADAEFVQEECRRLSVPCEVRRLGARERGVSVEAWARRERYRAISAVRRAGRYDWVLTAHTGSDLVETFLMRLSQNRQPGSIVRHDRRRRLLRPLLSIQRPTIEAYARLHDVPFREDESNRDLSLFRNQIRHKVLPQLRSELGPTLDRRLAARAETLMEDDRSLWLLAHQALQGTTLHELGSKPWTRALRSVARNSLPAVRWRLVSLAVLPWIGRAVGPELSARIESVVSGRSAAVQLPAGGRLARYQGGVRFTT